MRCFIGIRLSKKLKEDVNNFIKEIKNMDFLYGKYVESENLHVSLKFLGEVNPNHIKDISEALENINKKPFTISINHIGAFPNKNYVKVLWLGLDKGRNEVIELHRTIDEKLKNFFKKESRFEPHITLVRVKNVSNKEKVNSIFEKNIYFEEFEVDSFVLFKSTLTPDGPIYEEIKKFNLN